jgi:hypothetical protein
MAQTKELRRFEIDAIAHRIAEDVKTSKTKAHQKLRKTGAYKKLEKITQAYKNLDDSIKELEKKRQKTSDVISSEVSNWNAQNPEEHVRFGWSQYGNRLEFDFNEWSLKEDVQRRLAIALIAPDFRERLEEIIAQITKDLT